jgi:hypothetical protein
MMGDADDGPTQAVFSFIKRLARKGGSSKKQTP